MASTPKPTSGSSSSSSSTSAPKPNSTTRNVDKFGNVTERSYDASGNLTSQTRYNEKAGNVSRNPVTGKNEVVKTNPLGSSSSSNNSQPAPAQATTSLSDSQVLQSIKAQNQAQNTGAAQKINLSNPMQSRQSPSSPFIPNSDQIGKYKIVNTNEPQKLYSSVPVESNKVQSRSFQTMAQQSTVPGAKRVSILSMGASAPVASYEKPKERKPDFSNLPKSPYFKGSSTADAEAAKNAGQIAPLPKGVDNVYSYDPVIDSNTGAVIGTKITKRDYMTLAEANDYVKRQTPQYIADAKDIARTNAIVAKYSVKNGEINKKGLFAKADSIVDSAVKFSTLVAADKAFQAGSFIQNAPAEALNTFMQLKGDRAIPVNEKQVFGIDEATYKFLAPPAIGISPGANAQNIIGSTERIAAGLAIAPLGPVGAIAGGITTGGGIFSLASDFGKQVNYELLTNKARKEIEANYFNVQNAFKESQRNAVSENEKTIVFGIKSADLPLLTSAARFLPNALTSKNLRETVQARDTKAENIAYELTGSPVAAEFIRQQRVYSQTASDAGFIQLSMASNAALAKFTTPIAKTVRSLNIPFVNKKLNFEVGQVLTQETAALTTGKVVAVGTPSSVAMQIGTPLSITKRNVGSFLIGGLRDL